MVARMRWARAQQLLLPFSCACGSRSLLLLLAAACCWRAAAVSKHWPHFPPTLYASRPVRPSSLPAELCVRGRCERRQVRCTEGSVSGVVDCGLQK